MMSSSCVQTNDVQFMGANDQNIPLRRKASQSSSLPPQYCTTHEPVLSLAMLGAILGDHTHAMPSFRGFVPTHLDIIAELRHLLLPRRPLRFAPLTCTPTTPTTHKIGVFCDMRAPYVDDDSPKPHYCTCVLVPGDVCPFACFKHLNITVCLLTSIDECTCRCLKIGLLLVDDPPNKAGAPHTLSTTVRNYFSLSLSFICPPSISGRCSPACEQKKQQQHNSMAPAIEIQCGTIHGILLKTRAKLRQAP